MKKLCLVLMTLMLLCTLSFASGAWITNAVFANVADGKTLTFACTVDSIDTLTSNVFSLGKYNDLSWSTYPIPYQLYNVSAAGQPMLTAYVQGSNDNINWFVVDTLFSTDSLETVRYKTADFNNYKAVLYKLIIYGVTGCGSDTVVDMIFYFYIKDD